MAFSVTIDGVDRTAYVDEHVTVERAINAVGRITFSVVDRTGSYQPAQFDDVAIACTGITTRVGTIAIPPAVGYLQRLEGAGTVAWGTRADVTAHSPMARAGRTMRNGIDAGPITMKAVLQLLASENLATVGVTLAVGQATGPTFDTLTWPWSYASEVLDALCAAAAAATGKTWVWCIDDSFVLEAWEVGGKAAPQTLTAADIVGDIYPRADVPAFRNDQFFLYGPAEVRRVLESFAGDGATRLFPMRYQVAAAPGSVTVTDSLTHDEPVGTYGVHTQQWTFDAAYGSYGAIRQDAAYTVLAVGHSLVVPHDSQFPNVVHVQDGTSIGDVGVYVRKDSDPTLVDVDQATARANSLMAASIAAANRISVATHVHGCDPGELVTLSVGIAAINGAWLIERDRTIYQVRSGDDPFTQHVLDLVKGDLRTETSDSFVRNVLTGGNGGGAVAVAAAVGGGTTIVSGAVEGDLGGSRLAGVVHSTWAPVRDHREWRCPADGTYTAYVEAWTASASTSVQPRVYDITSSAVAGSPGSASTSTTAAKQQIVFDALAGHDYRLEVLPGNISNDVYGLGKVRA